MSTGRRSFLKTVALAGAVGEADAQAPAEAKRAEAAGQRGQFPYIRTFSGRQLSMISFPLGGVGAGCIGLGGRGQLRDWQIFNRPDYGRAAGYAFPAIWAKAGSGAPVVRVLESRLIPPYEAPAGLSPAAVSGLERLEDATFVGEYPVARVRFRDRLLPVQVSLEAFSPFVPLEAEESGLPVAVLRYRVKNPGATQARVSIAFSLDNPAGLDPRARPGNSSRPLLAKRVNDVRNGTGIQGLLMTNPETDRESPLAGSLAMSILGPEGGRVTVLRGWPRAKWWASPLLFWDDFSDDGNLGPEADEHNSVGSICLQKEIDPGKETEFTFLFTWHFPNRTPEWCGWVAPKGEESRNIGNYCAARFKDAWEVAEHTASKLPGLEKRMQQFLSAVRDTTIPAPVKEAAMANLSTLATPTCFRTSDGRFRGFEGIHDDRGCCHGSCTHVWNYESTTQYLFPTLARSMREAAFDLSERLDGVMPIRVSLPEGKQTEGITAADGTFGQIVKAYLDWELTGDDEWLKAMWPKAKKALEFAWVEGGWDADKDGVAEGVQHNTYDVEFYGPNPMCGIYYLAALRASALMADRVGESDFAEECRRLCAAGSKWIDENLFNGQYYIQKVRGIPVEKIAKPLRSRGGAEDPEHPDFQLAEGCLVDQLVGQYVADFAFLGPLVDPGKIRKTLESIYKYNHKHSLYSHNSVQRIFALNDEAALVICDYGEAKRPKVPFPYFAEVMTGFEYSAAILMLSNGMVKEGAECIENIRRRYDGERRNPWDEAECGRHYARAMAAWSGIVALSGFEYRGGEKRLVAVPKTRATNFTSFWSSGTGWGTFSNILREGRTRFVLSVLYGKLGCQRVEIATPRASGKTSATLGKDALAHSVKKVGNRSTFEFERAIEISEGQQLALTL